MALRLSSALDRVTISLTARVVMVDGWLFYDEPRAISGIEQGEGLDWFPERDEPGGVTCVPVGSMSRWPAAVQSVLIPLP